MQQFLTGGTTLNQVLNMTHYCENNVKSLLGGMRRKWCLARNCTFWTKERTVSSTKLLLKNQNVQKRIWKKKPSSSWAFHSPHPSMWQKIHCLTHWSVYPVSAISPFSLGKPINPQHFLWYWAGSIPVCFSCFPIWGAFCFFANLCYFLFLVGC